MEKRPTGTYTTHQLDWLKQARFVYVGEVPRVRAEILGINTIGGVRWTVSKNKSENQGLASADRSNKATLLLTAPSSMFVVFKGFPLSNIDKE